MKTKTGYFVIDDDSHWYLIPKKLVSRFEELLDTFTGDPDEDDEIAEEFYNTFDKYSLNGEPEDYKIKILGSK